MKRGRSDEEDESLVTFLCSYKDLVLPLIKRLGSWADVAHLFATCKQMRLLSAEIAQLPGGIWHLMLNHFYSFNHHPPQVAEFIDSLSWPETHRYEFFQSVLLAVYFKYGTALERPELLYENCEPGGREQLSFCNDTLRFQAFSQGKKYWQLCVSECKNFIPQVFGLWHCRWNHYYIALTSKNGDRVNVTIPINVQELTDAFYAIWTKHGNTLNYHREIPK